jgi:DNA-binding ferritin-like protein
MKLVENSKGGNELEALAKVVSTLMGTQIAAHLLHLSVTGEGSYASHVALQEYYEAALDKVDHIAEEVQGHHGKLLDIKAPVIEVPETVQDFVNQLDNLYIITAEGQMSSKCSALISTLDELKTLINKTKYKLLFLR